MITAEHTSRLRSELLIGMHALSIYVPFVGLVWTIFSLSTFQRSSHAFIQTCLLVSISVKGISEHTVTYEEGTHKSVIALQPLSVIHLISVSHLSSESLSVIQTLVICLTSVSHLSFEPILFKSLSVICLTSVSHLSAVTRNPMAEVGALRDACKREETFRAGRVVEQICGQNG